MRRASLTVLLAMFSSSGAVAQGTVPEAGVAWFPNTPRQGTFAYVVVQPSDPAVREVRGAVDRVPLYFERIGDRFVALGAVQMAAPDSVPIVLWLEYPDGRVGTQGSYLPVVAAHFATERLSVALQFSTEPDSALRVRIRKENRLAQEVGLKAQETPRLWRRPFIAPRDSRITSPYGIGRLFNGELRSRHWGTDFDGEMGDPVRAANRGVIELVDDFYYGGRVVYLNHGGGLVTAYLHLSETLVQQGDTVARGQLIGRVGQSGRVTGPHLHWSTRLGRATLDGASLLSLPRLREETYIRSK